MYTIARHRVDPVSLYDVHGIEELLEREEIDVPEISDGEEEGHRQRLIEVHVHVQHIQTTLSYSKQNICY